MGALDLGAIENENEKLKEFDTDIVLASKLPEGVTDIRIMPPSLLMNRLHFVRRTQYWIETQQGKRALLSSLTYDPNGLDVVDQEIAFASKNKQDAGLQQLLNNAKALNKQEDYLIPVYFIKSILDPITKVITGVEVIGNKVKFLAVPKTLLGEINQAVLSRFVQPDITDRVRGFNIMVTKTKENNFMKYKAQHWPHPMEMPERYYIADYCPIELLKSTDDSDLYKRSVIRNYLYGEPMLDRKTANSGSVPADPRFAQQQYPPVQAQPQAQGFYQPPVYAQAVVAQPTAQPQYVPQPQVAAPPVQQVVPNAQNQYPYTNAPQWTGNEPQQHAVVAQVVPPVQPVQPAYVQQPQAVVQPVQPAPVQVPQAVVQPVQPTYVQQPAAPVAPQGNVSAYAENVLNDLENG